MKTTIRVIRHFVAATAILGAGLLVPLLGRAAPAGSAAKAASLFSTDFSKGADAWTVTSGTFKVEGGAYRSRALTEDVKLSRAIVGEKTWTDYRVTARLKLEQVASPKADYGLIARYQDPNNYYIFLYKTEAKKLTIETKIKGKLKTVAEAPIELAAGRWHDFQVTVAGGNLSGMVDGRPLVQFTHTEFTAGAPGLLAYWADVQCSRFEVGPVDAR